MSLSATNIADILNANRAPLALCQDFADYLEDSDRSFSRPVFIAMATSALLLDTEQDLKSLRTWHA